MMVDDAEESALYHCVTQSRCGCMACSLPAQQKDQDPSPIAKVRREIDFQTGRTEQAHIQGFHRGVYEKQELATVDKGSCMVRHVERMLAGQEHSSLNCLGGCAISSGCCLSAQIRR